MVNFRMAEVVRTGMWGDTSTTVQLCSGSFFTQVTAHVYRRMCVTGESIGRMHEQLRAALRFLCPSRKEKNLPWPLLGPP